MKTIDRIRSMNRLRDVASEDGFEDINWCLVLHFVKVGKDGVGKAWKAEIATSAKEARRIIKEYEAKGWKNCWRVWGNMHISPN